MQDQNMFHCHLCSESFGRSVDLISHLKRIHKYLDGMIISCASIDCDREYDSAASFKKHLDIQHTVSDSTLADVSEEEEKEDSILIKMKQFFYHERCRLLQRVEDIVQDYLIKLYGKNITRADINEVVEDTTTMTKSMTKLLKDTIVQCYESAVGDTYNSFIDDIFSPFENSLDEFVSEYKRVDKMQNIDCYIAPQDYILGQHEISKFVNGKFIIYDVNATGQFISVRKVSEKFFSIEGVWKTVYLFMSKLINNVDQDSSHRSHFLQFDLYKKYRQDFPQKIVVPLKLAYDEYETNNPLGSHAGVHKLGAAYFSLLCLPPEFASKLNNVFMTLLFNSVDRKDFGMAAAVRPLVDELKELESIPFLKTKNKNEIFLKLLVITGDNLGVSELLKFVECFSANYPCRICRIHKTNMLESCEENPLLIRTEKDYDDDVRLNDVSKTGINDVCPFNRLDSYHCVTNLSCDIMHDINEGICRYILSKIIMHYINTKVFSLNELNQRIGGFDFGLVQSKNRPSFLRKEKLSSQQLGLTAIETYTLTKHFGLLIGDKVPVEDRFWQVYVALNKLILLLDKRVISPEVITDLKNVTENLCRLYRSTFESNIMFKLHMILHYPRLTTLLGPLKSLCVLQEEQKHRQGKIMAHLTHSRKNLPKTIAIHNQLKMCSRFYFNEGLGKSVEVGPKLTSVESRNYMSRFQNKVQNLTRVTNIKVNGIKYKEKMVLNVPNNEDVCMPFLPSYAIILDIFSNEDGSRIEFITKVISTIYYDNHYQAYKVDTECAYFEHISYSHLVNKFTTDILYNSNGDKFVVSNE